MFVTFCYSFDYGPLCNRICLRMIEITWTHRSSMRHSRKFSRQSMRRRERCSICTALSRTGTDCSGLSWWKKTGLVRCRPSGCSLQDLIWEQLHPYQQDRSGKRLYSHELSLSYSVRIEYDKTLYTQNHVHSAHQFLRIVSLLKRASKGFTSGTFRNLHIHRV